MRPCLGKRGRDSEGPAGKDTCHPARLSDSSPTCESSCQKPSDNTYVRMHVCAIHRISKKASEVIEYGRCILAYLFPCVSMSWSHSGRRRLALSSDFMCVLASLLSRTDTWIRELSGDECSPTLREVLESAPSTAKFSNGKGQTGSSDYPGYLDQSGLDETMSQKQNKQQKLSKVSYVTVVQLLTVENE